MRTYDWRCSCSAYAAPGFSVVPKNYEGATQTVLLLLVVYALLSAPILIAWMAGVKP
jgi:hypothetical protein